MFIMPTKRVKTKMLLKKQLKTDVFKNTKLSFQIVVKQKTIKQKNSSLTFLSSS